MALEYTLYIATTDDHHRLHSQLNCLDWRFIDHPAHALTRFVDSHTTLTLRQHGPPSTPSDLESNRIAKDRLGYIPAASGLLRLDKFQLVAATHELARSVRLVVECTTGPFMWLWNGELPTVWRHDGTVYVRGGVGTREIRAALKTGFQVREQVQLI